MSKAPPEEIRRKASRMLRFLLVQRGAKPGAKGWELKKHFGSRYLGILEVARIEAEKLGLKVRVVDDEEGRGPDFARYVLVVSENVAEIGASPLTVLDSAVLAVVLALSYGGRRLLPIKEVEAGLASKIPRWRAGQVLAKLARLGYIELGEDTVAIGWRSKAEIDLDKLAKALFVIRPGGSGKQPP